MITPILSSRFNLKTSSSTDTITRVRSENCAGNCDGKLSRTSRPRQTTRQLGRRALEGELFFEDAVETDPPCSTVLQNPSLILRLLQKPRQLGDLGGDGPGLVAGEQISRRSASRFVLVSKEAKVPPVSGPLVQIQTKSGVVELSPLGTRRPSP